MNKPSGIGSSNAGSCILCRALSDKLTRVEHRTTLETRTKPQAGATEGARYYSARPAQWVPAGAHAPQWTVGWHFWVREPKQ